MFLHRNREAYAVLDPLEHSCRDDAPDASTIDAEYGVTRRRQPNPHDQVGRRLAKRTSAETEEPGIVTLGPSESFHAVLADGMPAREKVVRHRRETGEAGLVAPDAAPLPHVSREHSLVDGRSGPALDELCEKSLHVSQHTIRGRARGQDVVLALSLASDLSNSLADNAVQLVVYLGRREDWKWLALVRTICNDFRAPTMHAGRVLIEEEA